MTARQKDLRQRLADLLHVDFDFAAMPYKSGVRPVRVSWLFSSWQKLTLSQFMEPRIAFQALHGEPPRREAWSELGKEIFEKCDVL